MHAFGNLDFREFKRHVVGVIPQLPVFLDESNEAFSWFPRVALFTVTTLSLTPFLPTVLKTMVKNFVYDIRICTFYLSLRLVVQKRYGFTINRW